MDSIKKHWKAVPATIRKPVVVVVGSILIIAAALTGWLPGPGGIPLFLVGIAVLATEFAWAKRLQDRVINDIKQFGKIYREHKVIGTIVIIIAIAIVVSLSILLYRHINR